LSLISQATNVLYVDNKRTDTYTEIGTYVLPFKTTQAAMDSITGNSSTNRFCIKIATGAPYTENLTFNKGYITLEGYGDTILSGNLTFETTAVHVKFINLKLTGNAAGAYTNAFLIDVCDCNTAKNKNWVFSCTVDDSFIQVSGQSTLWYANFELTKITGVIANQGGYFEGTHTFNECNGEFIGFENYAGTININAGSEIYIGAAMCIDTVVNLAEGATLHIDAVSASKLATLNNSGGTLDLTTPASSIQYDNTVSGLAAETVKAAIDENAAALAAIANQQTQLETLFGELGSPLTFKGSDTYANVSAIETPDNKDCWWDTTNGRYVAYNGSAWIAIGNLNINARIVNTEKLQKSSVTPEKTSYFTLSANLWDSSLNEVGRLNSSGVLDVAQTGYVTSPHIDVYGQAGQYIVPQNNGTIARNSLFFYDANEVKLSGEYGTYSTAVEIPVGAYTVRISLASTATVFAGINADGTAITYAAYSEKIPVNYLTLTGIKRENMDADYLTAEIFKQFDDNNSVLLDMSTNRYNVSNTTTGRLKTDGTVDATANTYLTTEYISVEGHIGEYVCVEQNLGGSFLCSGHVFYDSTKTLLSQSIETITTGFLVPAGVHYVRVSIPAVTENPFVGFNASNALVAFEKFYKKFKNSFVHSGADGYFNKAVAFQGDSIFAQEKITPWIVDFFKIGTYYNPSIGGTTVYNNETTVEYNSVTIDGWMSSDDRISIIPEDTDIIINFGGHNDWSESCPIGELGNFTDTTFMGAYALMLKKQITAFPNATIICCTPMGGRLSVEDVNQDYQTENLLDLVMTDYADAVKQVCAYYGIPCIDINAESGINTMNAASFLDDVVHPNVAGGKLVARAMINGMKRFNPYTF